MPYPKIIQNLINQFAKLPSIGPKTAERLVFYLLYQPQSELHNFGEAIEHLKDKIQLCQTCFNFSDSNPCHICADPKRNPRIICVVAKPQDMGAIEKSKFPGLYHILGGHISPVENMRPENLKIKELINRLKTNNIDEIILALNPDLPGETTTLYLAKLIKSQFPDLKITRLARGLPMGADLEYADEVTLGNAIKDRRNIN